MPAVFTVVAAAIAWLAAAPEVAEAVVIVTAHAVPGGLEAAQLQARAAIAATGPGEDVHVRLEPGIHHLAAPLDLGPADSGVGGSKVVWAGSGDPEHPTVLDGGISRGEAAILLIRRIDATYWISIAL